MSSILIVCIAALYPLVFAAAILFLAGPDLDLAWRLDRIIRRLEGNDDGR